MTGGYIICPQILSDKLVKDIYMKIASESNVSGVLTGYKDLCDFMLNALNIGKPIFMSGKVDIEYDLNSYWHVEYSFITPVSALYNSPCITLILDQRIIVVSTSDYSIGKIAFNVVS